MERIADAKLDHRIDDGVGILYAETESSDFDFRFLECDTLGTDTSKRIYIFSTPKSSSRIEPFGKDISRDLILVFVK